ncbi:hypothetical protein IFM89_008091 [Coptis chinensis]|uniref:RBR-type E3 ubiquitin transferase n=1 Tax=Coptis chinensis TaxID=261450 RepID=A0A835IVT8_9MAGN|nr:hypothetical protein IFM89_008091 [Coptis chinensis]
MTAWQSMWRQDSRQCYYDQVPSIKLLSELEFELCRSILPKEVYDRWGNALCESLILGAHKFYCPFEDCSALLIKDGGMDVKESECPHCRRMFCAQCKVPWHSGVGCEEFQKLKESGEREKEDKSYLTILFMDIKLR